MNNKNELRVSMLDTIKGMIEDNIISGQDLKRFISSEEELTEPEFIRAEMENWYRTLGIEEVIRDKFSLKLPYFTKEEIIEAYNNDEMILCVPKGITRKQLGTLFNIDSWALSDNVISNTTEVEDFWFKTKKSLTPDNKDEEGRGIKKIYAKEDKLGMSIERYLVFVARLRYLYKQTPDIGTSTWLLHGRYEKQAMLIAGFDSELKFTVHAWMPQFRSPKVGGRYAMIPDHLYL